MRQIGEHYSIAYGNEAQLGEVIRHSSIPRSEFYITTKWSKFQETTPLEACRSSLKAMGLDDVDLYFIHQVRYCRGDIEGTWREMEEIREMGLATARNIGFPSGSAALKSVRPVSKSRAACYGDIMADVASPSFKMEDSKTLLASCKFKPVVNQIYLSPNNIDPSSTTVPRTTSRFRLIGCCLHWEIRIRTCRRDCERHRSEERLFG